MSDVNSEDGLPVATPAKNIGNQIHPVVPKIMENEQAAQNQARRRSSSLAGASVPARTEPKKHRRRRSDNILEEGDEDSTDAEHSDSDSRSDSTDFELDDMSADGLEDDEETGLTKRDRRRRRKKKRRNTLLDQRIVPTDTYTKEEKKQADQDLYRDMLINAVLIGLW